MPVPKEAASDKAKVTLSFPDWKDGKIAPATFEVPVVDVSLEEEARAKREAEQSRRLREASLSRRLKEYKERLKKETDPRKRKQLQTFIGHMESLLQDNEKP